MSSAKILVVDDEPSILDIVTQYLMAEGYEILTAMDGIEGMEAARSFKPDLIVLDVMLPGMDGIEFLVQIRRESDVYVILLTARSEETDKIVGLSVGADDYLTKPFSPRELVARIKAALRRLQNIKNIVNEETTVLVFPHIRVDPGSRRIWVEDRLVEFTTIEFDLMYALAQNHGHVLSREKLMEKVWGYEYFGDMRVIDVHIGHIRQKFGKLDVLETIRGIGYRFEDR